MVSLLGRIIIDAGNLPGAIEVMESGLELVGESNEAARAELLANLSRAYMRSDHHAQAVATADRALDIAEHRNLERVVAEALINKGAALQNLSGRRREAAALLDMAVRMAHDGGWVEVELRGRNNLSVALVEDDPRRALEIIYEGVELARRLGQRSVFNWQVGTSAMYAQVIGLEWDRPLALLGEALASDSISEQDRSRMIAIAGILQVSRGELPAAVATDIDRLTALDAEPQTRGTLLQVKAIGELVAGQYPESFAHAMSSVEGWLGFVSDYVPTAFIAAILAGDSDRARTAARLIDESPSGSRWLQGLRAWTQAALAAIDGRAPEALKGFREGIDGLSGASLHWPAALAALTAVYLLPLEAETRAWADGARETFERTGAKPFLALLDELERSAAVKPSRASRTADEKEPTSV